MATLNAAECYGLKNKGAIAPGYIADLVIMDNMEDVNVVKVFKNGKLVAEDYKPLYEVEINLPKNLTDSVNIKEAHEKDLQIPMKSNKANVIGVIDGSLVTDKLIEEVKVEDGFFAYSDNDVLKLVVVERHFASGNVGVGLIKNIKLKNGAIGSTIGHDSHNLIVVGDNDKDILLAINELKNIGGGLTLVSNGKVVESLQLEIGGIMTSKPIEDTNNTLKKMIRLSHEKFRVNENIDPFMTLAFMPLPVIPKLKLTDMGLFDVEEFKFLDVSVE